MAALQGTVPENDALRGRISASGGVHGALRGLEKLQGYSAYQIAVLHGFEGTEAEWLASLKGAKGDPGAVAFDKLTEEQLAMLKGEPFTYEDFTPEQLAALKGAEGKPGYSPVKGVDYFDGKDGSSVFVEDLVPSYEDGGVNMIYFSDGSQISVKNGSKGSPGTNGTNGEDGEDGENGVGISSIVFKESTASGNVYTIHLSDGSSYDITAPIGPKGADGSGGSGGSGEDGEDGGYYVPAVNSSGVLSWTASKTGMPSVASVNIKGPQGIQGVQGIRGETGQQGPPGAAGENGYTPVRGTDYWTANDIATIKEYVDNAILGGAW